MEINMEEITHTLYGLMLFFAFACLIKFVIPDRSQKGSPKSTDVPECKARAIDKVNYLINLEIKGSETPERIFIGKELFQQFQDECLPIYKARYGGLVASQKACDDGYNNVLFHGTAVCLDCLEDNETTTTK